MGASEIRYFADAAVVERRLAQHQNGRVDKQSQAERHGRIDHRELDGLAFVLRLRLESARLHDARVQIQIVRHHRRAQDADGNVKHLAVAQNLQAGEESARSLEPKWPRKKELKA